MPNMTLFSSTAAFLNKSRALAMTPRNAGSKFITQLRDRFGVARSASKSLWLLLSGAAFDFSITAMSVYRLMHVLSPTCDFEAQQMETMYRQDHAGHGLS